MFRLHVIQSRVRDNISHVFNVVLPYCMHECIKKMLTESLIKEIWITTLFSHWEVAVYLNRHSEQMWERPSCFKYLNVNLALNRWRFCTTNQAQNQYDWTCTTSNFMHIQNKLAKSYWFMYTIYTKLFELNVLNALFGQSRKLFRFKTWILSYKNVV